MGSFDLAVSTYAVENDMDLGLRFHLVSGDGFSLALRGRLHEEHYLEGTGVALGSVSPGLLLSFGKDRMQWTVGTDGHVYLFSWVEGRRGLGFRSPWLRAFRGIRVRGSMNVDAQVHLETLQFRGGEPILEPGLWVGLSW